MPFYPKANAHNLNTAVNTRSPNGKAKRIIVQQGDGDSRNTVTIKPGSKTPYPDWQNQHGPTGRSAAGITDEEAEQMISLTAKMLSVTYGDRRGGGNMMLSGVGSNADDCRESVEEGDLSMGSRAAGGTLAGHGGGADYGANGLQQQGNDISGRKNKREKQPSTTLTAQERAEKIAQEMDARSEAEQTQFGLLHDYQEEKRRLQQQQQSGKGGGGSAGATRLTSPTLPTSRGGGGIGSQSRPSSHQQQQQQQGSGDAVGVDGLKEGIEVIQFDVTTPGGLAAHILATGGYACPDPNKPNPAIKKHSGMVFEEDVERGARTPPDKHQHLGVGLEHKGIVKPLATMLALQQEERTAVNSSNINDPTSSSSTTAAAAITANASSLHARAANPSAAAGGGGGEVTYSPIRLDKSIGADRPMSPMAALRNAAGAGGGGGVGGGTTVVKSYMPLVGRQQQQQPIDVLVDGEGVHHFPSARSIPRPSKYIHIKDVPHMSKQPWAFQDAVLDAQIMTDAQLDHENLKSGRSPSRHGRQPKPFPLRSVDGDYGDEGDAYEQQEETTCVDRDATNSNVSLHVSKVAGRNPKAAMLLPRSSDYAYDNQRDAASLQHCYNNTTGTISVKALELMYQRDLLTTRDKATAPSSPTAKKGRSMKGVNGQRLSGKKGGGGGKQSLFNAVLGDNAAVRGDDDDGDGDEDSNDTDDDDYDYDDDNSSYGDEPKTFSRTSSMIGTARGEGASRGASHHHHHHHAASITFGAIVAAAAPLSAASSSSNSNTPQSAQRCFGVIGGAGGKCSSLASLADESPFMRQKRAIGERILQNTFTSVEEKEQRTRISSAQRKRGEWKSAANAHSENNGNGDVTVIVEEENGGANATENKNELTSIASRSGKTREQSLSDFTEQVLSNVPGRMIATGIVVNTQRSSLKNLPPSSMTTRDVFIAQQRLLNSKLRQMFLNKGGEGGNADEEEGVPRIEPEDLPNDDSDAALGKQYDHLLPFLQMEDGIETRRFRCELWTKHIALAMSIHAFEQILSKNRARHTIRHVAIPMVMRWIKTYRRNRTMKNEINLRMDEVLVKRPNSALLRQRNQCFADWSDAMIDRLLEHARFVPYSEDQFVMFQGEPTKEIYLVVSGEVEVVVMDKSSTNPGKIKSRRVENGKVVASLGPGQIFGEIASTTCQPRCASVRCVTRCDLLCLAHTDFARAGSSLPERSWQLLKKQCQETRVENIGKVFPLEIEDVQRHNMFAHWSHSAATALTEAFKPIFLPQGEYIFMPPLINENACLIIFSGRVKVVNYDNDGHPIGDPVFYGPGDIIGEKETVMVVKRSFNAVCVEPLEGYLLSRGDYVTAAMHNATFAAKSREIVAARIAETWVRPSPPAQFLEDPVLSYLVSEEVLRSLWSIATPKLIWQSELMFLAGQPCEHITIVVRGTFHERATTTRATSKANGGGGGQQKHCSAFGGSSSSNNNSPSVALGTSGGILRGSAANPSHLSAAFFDRNTTLVNTVDCGSGSYDSQQAKRQDQLHHRQSGSARHNGPSPPEISIGINGELSGASTSNLNASPFAFDVSHHASNNRNSTTNANSNRGNSPASPVTPVSAMPNNTSSTLLAVTGGGGSSAGQQAQQQKKGPNIQRSSSNLAAALLLSSGSLAAEEWNPTTDAAFLPPHLRRLEQRITHKQYEEGLDNGDAVVFGQLEIGLNHAFYLRTVWCTGTCHVWQIPRQAFEALVKKEHPRVWDAIVSPKTMETILENAENLNRLANDSNPPRRAGI